MRLSRFTVAAVLAASALALTACDSDDPPSGAASAPAATASAPAATASAPAATASAGATGGAAASPKPATSPGKSTAAATGKAGGPSADCTAGADGVKVIEATENAYATHLWVRARATRFVCGPDVPNDGYWEPQGEPRVYEFEGQSKSYLLNDELKVQEVDPITFMKVMDSCLHGADQAAAPYRCYGNQYEVKLDAQGKVTLISQLYHP
ncbi:hypothetical protein ACFV6F_06665 [Kitasatospora phosalacinea]|uniref:hypothetical protein n=1 Tax=Kitasatospora phosalacinea TaxID=2065 RepID=UPI0036490365